MKSLILLALVAFVAAENIEVDQFDDICKSLTFVSRREWNATETKLKTMQVKPVEHVFIHHTYSPGQCNTTEACKKAVKGIQRFHMKDRGWDDIGYNFLVGGDNKVYVARDWDKIGAHTRGMNDKAIAICIIGDFMKVAPKQSMLDVTQKLIACGKQLGFVGKEAQIHGHRNQNCTSCPGDKLYNILKNWKNFKGGRLPTFTPRNCTLNNTSV